MSEAPEVAALRKKLMKIADQNPRALELIEALVDQLLMETINEPPRRQRARTVRSDGDGH